MDDSKQQIIEYSEKASVVLLGILFIIFPLTFTNITTDVFTLPKQLLLSFLVLALLLLYGAKTFFAQSLNIRRTPFDLPMIIFGVTLLLSTIFSVAKFDSIYNFIPMLFAVFSFFAITYNVKALKQLYALLTSLLLGGAIVSLFAVTNFLKIYLIPLDFTHSQTFSTLGSVLDQTIYLGALLILGASFLYPYVKRGIKNVFSDNNIYVPLFGLLSLIILIGFTISIYLLIALQNPLILPLATGFQTAFAAISQDSARIILGFLFGTGFGEFSIAFMRFKQAAFNADPNLWTLTFFRSTSFILELLTTTGILGLAAFVFICYRIFKEKPLFIPLIVFIVAAFVLPLGFSHIVLLFIFMGLYSSLKAISQDKNYFDVELSLIASKKGFFMLSEDASTREQEKYGKILSSIVLTLIVIFTLIFGFLLFNFASANATFQKSFVSASQNNGSQTYTFQSNTLNTFTGKYVDAYYRVFSQTNLALANSLANSTPKGSSPSAQTTQTIYTLVQQSINSGRQATTISPSNALNWQNLAIIYRSLIGFGQNAESFAILAARQSAALDPTNPQEYITLGGIYYQLSSWDNAIAAFQQAVNLKPNFANAYYNLAHALIQKGDLQNGLSQLQTVKNLVANDKTSSKKIDDEIKTLQDQIAAGTKAPINTNLQGTQPTTALPAQNPPVKIPGPTITPQPSVTPSPTSQPTPTP